MVLGVIFGGWVWVAPTVLVAVLAWHRGALKLPRQAAHPMVAATSGVHSWQEVTKLVLAGAEIQPADLPFIGGAF